MHGILQANILNAACDIYLQSLTIDRRCYQLIPLRLNTGPFEYPESPLIKLSYMHFTEPSALPLRPGAYGTSIDSLLATSLYHKKQISKVQRYCFSVQVDTDGQGAVIVRESMETKIIQSIRPIHIVKL